MRVTEQDQLRARIIAFYLPQFYPTPENDQWWGRGFTEWTNVAKAKPLFPGHYQPHLPADLGFYDLRVPETRAAQAELAQAHGIEGFCYWHYWFEGRRILDRPFEEVLRSGEPDFPFCLGWANHTWSRRWTGMDDDILIKQTYSPQDDVTHGRWVAQAFADHRYIRVQGRPLFVIYNPHHLPDAHRTTDTFRQVCVAQGLPEPYLVGINAARREVDVRTLGFDATLDHQPNLGALPKMYVDEFCKSRFVRNLLRYKTWQEQMRIFDYAEALELTVAQSTDYPSHPCMLVGWDTTPRRGAKAVIMTDTTPDAFRSHLGALVQRVGQAPADERIVFLNAWNEWGEGMHLEPDTKWGKAFLEAVRDVVKAGPAAGGAGGLGQGL